MSEHILLRDQDIADIGEYDVYVKHGGFAGYRKALTSMSSDDVINEVKAAGLRGRGGAGFPTGVKWSFIPKNEPVKYVAVNADESEPGTFKDRQLMEKNPYQVLEGALLCGYAIRATAVYIYLRGEFWDVAAILDRAIEKLRQEGLVGENILDSGWSCEVYTHLGAGAYICGEESALLNSLQGFLGQPRVRPPFPAQKGGGLYYEPTVVNNVETLANVPYILREGADAYKQFGTEKSPGVKIFSISGHAKNPGNYEVPLGTTFRELIFDIAGGLRDDAQLKAILTAGASAPILPATDKVLDAPLTYEDVITVGSSLGSASFILMDDSVNIAWAASKMITFFSHESCGKCTPCREGTYWLKKRYQALLAGGAKESDIDVMVDVANHMGGVTLCALGDFAKNPVTATVQHFRDDYLEYIAGGEKKAPKKSGGGGPAFKKGAAAR